MATPVYIEFVKVVGNIAPKFKITPFTDSANIILKSLYNESMINGKKVELLEVTEDANGFVGNMTFGLSPDSELTDISANIVYQKFFAADRDYYAIAVTNNGDSVIELNCGTSSGGTDVFSGESIAAGQRKLIPISVSPTVDTAAYFHSSDWDGNTVNVKSHSDEA